MRALAAVLRKELHDAVASRWLLAFSVTFAVVALALAIVQRQGGALGSQGFTRTTAGLISLCLLLVPLLSLVLGAGAIAGERDRGTLAALLAQPLSVVELMLGKYLGLTIGIWMAIALGFGIAGLLMATVTPITQIGTLAFFVVLSGLLSSAMLSLGMLISVLADGRTKALAGAIALWFALVLLYDLGAIGLALAISSSGRTLLLAVLANPVECVRILAILGLEPDLRILGPLGSYLVGQLGVATTVALLAASLAAWAGGPLVLAIGVLRRQDV